MTLAYAEHAVGVPDATGIRAPPMIDLPFPDATKLPVSRVAGRNRREREQRREA